MSVLLFFFCRVVRCRRRVRWQYLLLYSAFQLSATGCDSCATNNNKSHFWRLSVFCGPCETGLRLYFCSFQLKTDQSKRPYFHFDHSAFELSICRGWNKTCSPILFKFLPCTTPELRMCVGFISLTFHGCLFPNSDYNNCFVQNLKSKMSVLSIFQ